MSSPPAHYVLIGPDGAGPERRWWDIDFSPVEADEDDLIDEVEELLTDSIRIRLRADVEVGAYLSGGLDSSAIAAIAARQVGEGRLSAFGLRVRGRALRRERGAGRDRRRAGRRLPPRPWSTPPRSRRRSRVRSSSAEKPMLRTAPAPLLRLAGAVQRSRAEGGAHGRGRRTSSSPATTSSARTRCGASGRATRRRSCARCSSRRLNRWLATDPARAGAFLTRFYAQDLLATDDPLYSHRLRFENTARSLRMLNPELLRQAEAEGQLADRLRAALPASLRALLAAGEGAVRRDRDLLRGLPAAYAGRPDADGALDRGALPVRGRASGGARSTAPGLAPAARPPGEVRTAQSRRARAPRRDPVSAEGALPRADPRRLLRPYERPLAARARGCARCGPARRDRRRPARGQVRRRAPGQRDRRDGARRLDVADDPQRPPRRQSAAGAGARAVRTVVGDKVVAGPIAEAVR